MSDRSELVMLWTADLSSKSNWSSAGCETDGEQRRRWRTFGALNDDLRRVNASWEPSWRNLLTALEISSQRSDQAWSSADPGNSGAPRSVVSFGSAVWNDRNRWSVTETHWCTISSHLAAFRDSPIWPPTLAISATAEATLSTWHPSVCLLYTSPSPRD